MTRTLFFLTCLAAMLMAVTAVLIRIELAHAGVSPLFSGADGAADGQKFTAVATSHAILGYLAAMLLGTTMTSAARRHGAPLAGLMMTLGLLASLFTFAMIVLAHIPALPVDQTGTGWTLYPELTTGRAHSALDGLADLINLPSLLYVDLTQILILPTGAILYLGAYAMLSTQPGLRWVGVVGLILTILLILAAIPSLQNFTPINTQASFILLSLPFLACAAIRIVDGAPAWVLTLALGVLATLVAEAALLGLWSQQPLSGTVAEIAALYVFPLGLAWFALPAFIMFTARRTDPWPAWAPWAIAAALTFTLTAWLVPLVRLGLDGQPMRYVDYPSHYGADNLLVSAAVAQFILIYLVVITLTRRAAR